MKLRITNLKAPWPSGARIDDVVELPGIPAWAVGKCAPAPDDAEVTAVMSAPEPVRDFAAELAQAEERLELAKQAAVSSYEAVRADLDAAEARLAEALAANAALSEGKAQAEARLAEALAQKGKGK